MSEKQPDYPYDCEANGCELELKPRKVNPLNWPYSSDWLRKKVHDERNIMARWRSECIPRGHQAKLRTGQMFRLSDLKLLSTEVLDPGDGQFGQINPEEALRGPDGAVCIQTTGCGVERVTDLADAHPKSHLVYQFPGSMCGVPSLVSHYWIQPVQVLHAVVVLDLAAPGGPKEISRVVLDGVTLPHWSGYDARTHRLAVTGYAEERLFMLQFDPATGALSLDRAHVGLQPVYNGVPRDQPLSTHSGQHELLQAPSFMEG